MNKDEECIAGRASRSGKDRKEVKEDLKGIIYEGKWRGRKRKGFREIKQTSVREASRYEEE